MSTRVFVLRPEPGLAATVAALENQGIAVVAEPIAAVVPVEWEPPADTDFDALLIGSANALRHAGPALERWRGREAHVVGSATAEVARGAGLSVATIGSGGLQALVDMLGASGQRLLRLTGEAHVPLVEPEGISIISRVVYRIEYRSLPATLAAQLALGGVVLLHSGEAAAHFARECDRLGIERARLSLAALAPRIARAAGAGWAQVSSAPEPSDAALLALARELCQ